MEPLKNIQVTFLWMIISVTELQKLHILDFFFTIYINIYKYFLLCIRLSQYTHKNNTQKI